MFWHDAINNNNVLDNLTVIIRGILIIKVYNQEK